MDAETWHIPLRCNSTIIREALERMEGFKLDQNDVPFVIRLFENPKYKMLPGAVTLDSHDIIHVLLGRGLLPKDEAFVIGFTMGTAQVSALQKRVFRFVSRFLYPDGYRFRTRDLNIFENGIRCAKIMDCSDLSKVDLTQYTDYTIEMAREELDIDVGLLETYYRIEKRKNQNSPECQRLTRGFRI